MPTLDAAQMRLVEQTLDYGTPTATPTADDPLILGYAAPRHDFAVVVEGDRHRSETAALPALRRIERGVAFHVLDAARRGRCRTRRWRAAAAAARPHDRDRDGRRWPTRQQLFRHVPPRELACDRRAGRRPRGAGARQPRARPGAVGRRDRLPGRELQPHRAQSHRCRADDVRAGQFRALPPQDFQRLVGDRRRGAGEDAVRHDPRHPRRPSRRHGGGVFGQFLGHRRRDRSSASIRAPTAATPTAAS